MKCILCRRPSPPVEESDLVFVQAAPAKGENPVIPPRTQADKVYHEAEFKALKPNLQAMISTLKGERSESEKLLSAIKDQEEVLNKKINDLKAKGPLNPIDSMRYSFVTGFFERIRNQYTKDDAKKNLDKVKGSALKTVESLLAEGEAGKL